MRNILQRIVENGLLGPEWAAMDKVLRHSAELLLHEFLRKCPIMLKDALKFIENDEVFLKQTYKKSTVQK